MAGGGRALSVTPHTSARDRVEVREYGFGRPGYLDAALYDELRYSGAANDYKQRVMRNAYRGLMGSLVGKRVLDVGCGTGRGVADFTDEAEFAVGIDASHDMLSLARGKMPRAQRSGLAVAHAQRLPILEGSFDVVISLHFLHLFRVDQQRAMVAEMKRVVKPGGILVLEFGNGLHGIGVGLYKRWKRNERGPLPREIRSIIGDDFRLVRIYGAVLPVTWRLFHRFPNVFAPLEKITYLPLLNRLSHRVYYMLQAPRQA